MEWNRIWPSIDNIFGWLSEAEAKRLYELAAEGLPRGSIIIELGAFMGRSTAALAYGLQAGGHKSFVVSIDTWQGSRGGEAELLCQRIMREHGVSDLFALHRDNMRARGLDSLTRRIRGTTVPAGSEWAHEWNVLPGLVFIDADHEYAGVKADADAFAPLLPLGGYLAFHDSWAPGPKRTIAELPAKFRTIQGAGDLAVLRVS